MKIAANGLSFHYRIDGREGAPWILFSNSLATNLSMWDEQVAALGDAYRILRYDQRGHGLTDAPKGPYHFGMLVADAIALMDALSIARAHFVGLSMGGMTGLGLGQRHRARFDRLVICDCGPASSPQSAQQWAERIAVAEKDGMEALVDSTLARWFPAETIAANPPFIDKVRGMIRSTPVNGYVGCAEALSNFDFRPGLAGIAPPVQLMVGTKDAMVSGIKAIHAAIPGATLVELEGAGHLSNLDASGSFTRALRDFLKN